MPSSETHENFPQASQASTRRRRYSQSPLVQTMTSGIRRNDFCFARGKQKKHSSTTDAWSGQDRFAQSVRPAKGMTEIFWQAGHWDRGRSNKRQRAL
jgi:hypothetical protein